MSDIIYKELIKDMTWSYSRASGFETCPYRWYLTYIKRLPKDELFFSSYGSFVHKLIERFYKGEIEASELAGEYLCGFSNEVKGQAPSAKIFDGYFKGGLDYFKNFKPLPFRMIDVEKKIRFKIGDVDCVCIVDYIGENEDGGLVLVDNKAKALKPRSKRKAPTKTDIELDSYLRQLYLYSAAVEQKYGKTPETLCFNCYRTNVLITEPFRQEVYEDSLRWFLKTVSEIEDETDFDPDIEWFKCKHLCEQQNNCEYFELTER